jgi:uncharacterized integral membrane protein
MQRVKLGLGVGLILLLGVFTVQNASVVSIHFLFWTFTMSRVLMIFFVLAIGIIIGMIAATHRHPSPPEKD